MRKNAILTALSLLLLTVITSCNGILGGIYDDPQDEEQLAVGFNGSKDAVRYKLLLDATSYDSWIYISLHHKTMERIVISDTTAAPAVWDGKTQWTYYKVLGDNYSELRSKPVQTQRDAEEWDVAVHHFDVKTNGATVLETPYSSIDDLPQSSKAFENEAFTPDRWMKNQCMVDISGMLSFNIWYVSSTVNPVLSRWVTMDFSVPPPVYSSTGKVYLLRFQDGTCAALRLLDYMNAAGEKGWLTIDVKYPY